MDFHCVLRERGGQIAGPADGQTNQQTDSYRDARAHLENSTFSHHVYTSIIRGWEWGCELIISDGDGQRGLEWIEMV